MQREEVMLWVVLTNQRDRSGFDTKMVLFKSCEMHQKRETDQSVIVISEEVNDSH